MSKTDKIKRTLNKIEREQRKLKTTDYKITEAKKEFEVLNERYKDIMDAMSRECIMLEKETDCFDAKIPPEIRQENKELIEAFQQATARTISKIKLLMNIENSENFSILQSVFEEPPYKDMPLSEFIGNLALYEKGRQEAIKRGYKPPTIEALEAATSTVYELEDIAKNPKLPKTMDLVNKKLLDLFVADGQMSFTDKFSLGDNETAVLSLSFDEEQLKKAGIIVSKKLTMYETLIIQAFTTLYAKTQNHVFSLNQLYYYMGYTKNLNDRTAKELNDELTKLGMGRVFMQSKDNNDPDKSITVDANILNFKRVQAAYKGNLVGTAILAREESPLIEFAKKRGEITAIPLRLYQWDKTMRKTELNLKLFNYLIERIAAARNPHNAMKPIIAIDTILENCGISPTDSKQRVKRTRTIKTLFQMLDFLKTAKYTDNGETKTYIHDYKVINNQKSIEIKFAPLKEIAQAQ